jgi:hypothetical protein
VGGAFAGSAAPCVYVARFVSMEVIMKGCAKVLNVHLTPLAVIAFARTFAPTVPPVGGGGGEEDWTQHWMSLLPGQNPAWKDPPLQPLFETLRQ